MSLKHRPFTRRPTHKRTLEALVRALNHHAAHYDVPPDSLLGCINQELCNDRSPFRIHHYRDTIVFSLYDRKGNLIPRSKYPNEKTTN